MLLQRPVSENVRWALGNEKVALFKQNKRVPNLDKSVKNSIFAPWNKESEGDEQSVVTQSHQCH